MCRLMWMGVVTLVLSPLSSLAGDHHLPELHVSMALPDDWVRMAKPEIEFLNQLRARRPGVRYLAGYRHKGARNDQSPCIIFYQLPSEIRGNTYDDLKRALNKEIDARVEELDRPILDMVLVLPDGSVGLDRHRKRILFGATTEILDGRSNALTVGYLGLDRVLIAQSFAREQDIRRWAAVFLEAHESIRFDDGFEFDPGARSILSEKLRVVVYGAVFLGFTIVAVRYLIRRNRRLQNPPDSAQ